MRLVRRLLTEEHGATAAEYALILSIVGAAIIIAALALGASITQSMQRSQTQIETCGGGC